MHPSPPSPPWVAGTTTTRTGWPAACRPPAMVPSWLQCFAGRWRCCCHGDEREGGAGRRLAEFLEGVRRTKIEAGRYKAGWMRLSAGGRKRRAAEEEEGGSVGGRDPDRDKGRGASLGVAGDSDGWGPDDRASDAPPVTFRKGGVSPPASRRSPQTRGRQWLGRWG